MFYYYYYCVYIFTHSQSHTHTHSLSLVLVMIKSKELKIQISHAQSLIRSHNVSDPTVTMWLSHNVSVRYCYHLCFSTICPLQSSSLILTLFLSLSPTVLQLPNLSAQQPLLRPCVPKVPAFSPCVWAYPLELPVNPPN